MTYLYIHGFGGSGLGSKAGLFRARFGSDLIAPSLSYVPDLAIDTLEQLVERLAKRDALTLIGSSLGGYYAAWLAEKYELQAVLINPSVRPYETLHRMVGEALCYHDLSHFEWNERHVAMLRKYDTAAVTSKRYLVFLQTGDELLDYTQAEQKFAGGSVVVEEGGEHSYVDIESKFDWICDFAHSQP